jgi:hypothetical protein
MIRRTLMFRAYGARQSPRGARPNPPDLPSLACYRLGAFGRDTFDCSKGDDLLRTRKSRPIGGAILVVLTIVMALVAGALGVSAQADDVGPGAGTSTAADPQSTGSGATGNGPARTLLGPAPAVAQPISLPLALDQAATVDLRPYVTCPPAHVCTFAPGVAPAGWPYSVTPDGILTVKVPRKTTPRAYAVPFSVTDTTTTGATEAAVAVLVTPDFYTPGNGMVFSHPYRKHYRNKIRNRILRMINSVPPGQQIRLASWSFNSKAYRQALRHARNRGVIVQVVLAHNKKSRYEFKRLRKMLGTAVSPTGNWVRRCALSCRGTGGTMHSKIFAFSQVYRTPFVTMTGSANLTDFAVSNQWNQMNVTAGPAYQPVYDEAARVFDEMPADTPVAVPYVSTFFAALGITSYFYPRGAVTQANDFMMDALAPVHCRGAVNAGKGGRTIIRIAMYAWYQTRGKWLAKRVRQLWQQGCDVRIVFAISSNPVKSILYSPAGRGRVPMRQILLTNREFIPIYYLHDKWVSITGHYGDDPGASVSYQGSFNFSDIGFSSDENFQRIDGRATYKQFAKDFKLLWTDRQARAPSPISKIPTIEGRFTKNDLRLGTGVYRYMEAD